MTSYIDSQIINAEGQLRLYSHRENKPRPYRYAFSDIIKKVENFRLGDETGRLLLMPGIRGVGKTTILAQTYQYLLSIGTPRKRILYASMDSVCLNLGTGLNDLVNAYEERSMLHFEDIQQGDEVFILLDEVQYDPDWAVALKLLYDRSRRVFILATGSSMIALTSTADISRRASSISIDPLSFTEFLRIGEVTSVSVSKPLSEAILSRCTIMEKYQSMLCQEDDIIDMLSQGGSKHIVNYLRTGTMPSTIGIEPPEAFARINATLDKVIDQDLSTVRSFDRSTLIKTHQLLTSLAVADRISHESLCTNLGLNNRTLIEMLDSLEAAGIIHRIRPFGSESTRVRKTPKFKFVAPAMRVALLAKIGRWGDKPDEMGQVFEDVAALYLKSWVAKGMILGFDYMVEDGMADLVIRRKDGRTMVMEISWGGKGIEQVVRAMDKVGADQGMIVADNPLGLTSDPRILRIPKEWFLLSM